MNTKVTNFFKSSRRFIGKHSPEILTGIGIAGMITSTVLAVKATPKALELIGDKKEELGYPRDCEEHLTVVDTVKAAWTPYIPAALMSLASASCIIGASAVSAKRNAALATAYAISERTLVRYRDKVVETLGDKKEKEIRDKVAQDEVSKKNISNSQVIVTSNGNTLFMDGVSGRTFRSSMDRVNKVVNELNRRMNYENYISLDDFYSELGLESTDISSQIGWNLDDGLIQLDVSTCLADNDEPCIYLGYRVAPRYEYDKLM